MDLTKNFEVLNFIFSDILLGKVSTNKILSFYDQHFKKFKDQKFVKFRFLAFSAGFLKFLPSKPMVF